MTRTTVHRIKPSAIVGGAFRSISRFPEGYDPIPPPDPIGVRAWHLALIGAAVLAAVAWRLWHG